MGWRVAGGGYVFGLDKNIYILTKCYNNPFPF